MPNPGIFFSLGKFVRMVYLGFKKRRRRLAKFGYMSQGFYFFWGNPIIFWQHPRRSYGLKLDCDFNFLFPQNIVPLCHFSPKKNLCSISNGPFFLVAMWCSFTPKKSQGHPVQIAPSFIEQFHHHLLILVTGQSLSTKQECQKKESFILRNLKRLTNIYAANMQKLIAIQLRSIMSKWYISINLRDGCHQVGASWH